MTRNGRLTLVFSVAAIIISVGQLLFSSQFFTDLMIKPDIYVSAKDYVVDKGEVITTFKILNNGNKTAEDIIVSFTCFKDDKYTIIPIGILDTSVIGNGEPLKNVIIKSNKFVPNDFIFIQVYSDTLTFSQHNKQIKNQNIRPNAFIIPNLNFVKYKDALVKIDRYAQN